MVSGSIHLAGEAELLDEDRALDLHWRIGNPLVEPALADGGLRVFFQQRLEPILPTTCRGVRLPGMDAERG